MKITVVEIPQHSSLHQQKFDYADSFQTILTNLSQDIDLDTIVKAFFTTSPAWVTYLLRLRNKLVGWMGLKTGEGVDNPEKLLAKTSFEVGDQLGLFKIYERSAQEIILGEDDRHLDFRVSLYLGEPMDEQRKLIVTTIVNYNNGLGKGYFFFVKPFHKVIVPYMMKAMVTQLHQT